MPNMTPGKTPMPEQAPDIRTGNFSEVALGYTPDMAMEEATRCLGCKHAPCVNGCPVGVQIPQFIGKIAEGKFDEAYDIIRETNMLPAVCGRVCPQENQCEKVCVRGIKHEPVAIGRLERFAADIAASREAKASPSASVATHKGRVAVVGSGPASLTCAGELATRGYDVTVFEALHEPGGVLVYGIPEFRLPKAIVKSEMDNLKALGVTLRTNAVVGRTFTVDELMEDGYEAIFVGSGAGLPQFMKIPGEGAIGVYSANEYLTRINLMKAYKPGSQTPLRRSRSVAVVGGGNVAVDAARCARRMGAEVRMVYRRGEAEMPARLEEIHHAKEEGVILELLTNPVEVLTGEDGQVSGLKCVRMALGEPDASGRRSPKPIAGSEFDLDVDTVIMAVGTSPNPLIKDTTPGLEINRWGGIVVDEYTATSRAGIFAGGDAVTGAATVILAMGAGRDAANAIDDYLTKKR